MIGKAITVLFVFAGSVSAAAENPYDYRILATNKTSTMEKEMNQAAEQGYRVQKAMGGDSAFGGSEVVVVMARNAAEPSKARYSYKLLAANKTSTMEKELQDAGSRGFDYKDQTVFKSSFGGDEVVTILEMDRDAPSKSKYEYRLLATNKTSTMQTELQEAGVEGFMFVGVTVSKTAFGGKEIVSILRRETVR
jgi:hypothetical protein